MLLDYYALLSEFVEEIWVEPMVDIDLLHKIAWFFEPTSDREQNNVFCTSSILSGTEYQTTQSNVADVF